jgi:hypothetical protein
MAWSVWVALDLLPQLPQVRAKVLTAGCPLGPPDGRQQVLLCHEFPGAAREGEQDLGFERSEVNFATFHDQGLALHVDVEALGSELSRQSLRGNARRLPEPNAHTSE